MKHFRSLLYIPCSNAKALEKSLTLTRCDGFIFDLEDAVGVASKHAARSAVCAFVERNGSHFAANRQHVAIRVNGLKSKWYEEDVEALKRLRASSPAASDFVVVLPKAETGEEIARVRRAIDEKERTQVWSMIETPRGVISSYDIAKESNTLIMGLEDLSNELRCSKSDKRAALMSAMQNTILAARAFEHVKIFDGVYTDLNDDEGFKEECRQGVSLGFDGKTLIHPKTIEAANEAFSPSPQQIEAATKLIKAYEASKGGAIQSEGKLIEDLHYRRALSIVASAESARR